MPHHKNWSKEEIEYLELKYGTISIPTICKQLNRSSRAVLLKAHRLGLGGLKKNVDALTPGDLSRLLKVRIETIHKLIKHHDLPTIEKRLIKARHTFIKTKDFWKWANDHRHLIDFSKLEKRSMGPEPKWLEEMRNADIIKNFKIRKSFGTHWSEEEDRILKGMLKSFTYTYPEIAERIGRSESAIRRRIDTLNLKERPVRKRAYAPDLPIKKQPRRMWSEKEDTIVCKMCAENRTAYEIATALDRSLSSIKNRCRKLNVRCRPIDEYTAKEVDTLVTLVDKGYSIVDVASRINKTAAGARGKLERMGYKFKNGEPYKLDRFPKGAGA